MAWAEAHPAQTARLVLRKFLLFWGPWEVAHGKKEDLERRQSALLQALPGSFAHVLTLALVGATVCFAPHRRSAVAKAGAHAPPLPAAFPRDDMRPVAVLAALFIIAYCASLLPFFVAGQYRTAVVPFLMLFAAMGLRNWGELLLRRRFLAAGIWATAALAVFGVVSRNPTGYAPDYAQWHYDRGVAFMVAGDSATAMAEYEAALRLRPAMPMAHNNLGILRRQAGQVEEALAHFAEAIHQAPDYVEARFNLANTLAEHNHLTEAVDHYETLLRIHPGYVPARLNCALALELLGRRRDAATHLREVLRQDPGNATARERLQRLGQ